MNKIRMPYQIGDFVTVKGDSTHLPAGLPNGAIVRVVGINLFQDDVDYEGRCYRIPAEMISVSSQRNFVD